MSTGVDMNTQQLDLAGGTIGFDDSGGSGPLVVMLPGAGDVRHEYRLVAPDLVAGGARVVTMDLRGHGDSSADWPGYGVVETAGDLVALLDHLDAGPATVVATSFSPAAALWAAADRPDLIGRLVLISAHLETAPIWQRIPLGLMLRGPFAGGLWSGQFRKWHPAAPPADLGEQAAALAKMMADPRRRRAVRETLTAHRNGLAERIARVDVPTLVVMGGADSHFKDPAATGESIAADTGGKVHVVPDAGHYPHVEFPGQVTAEITDFLAETRT
ncbi:MAG: alpha/beta hydrolase [Acidimicrobiia bacterium]|nr:alpha/beta hydrolase [Acidimicrobiia bacterium]